MHFADRLQSRIDEVNSRIVIGIDPDPKRVFSPQSRLQEAFSGKSSEYVLETFCRMIVDVAKEYACAVKPQAAFFECMGIMGLTVLSRVILYARSLRIPVILDAKRGDIGNTASAYATAYLEPNSDFFADALTVNPFLGPDTLRPFIETANKNDCGLFVLVKTSNAGSSVFQDLRVLDEDKRYNTTVSEIVGAEIANLGDESLGTCGFSNIGAVVGATYPESMIRLRQIMPHTIFLLPGYGAQGGTAQDVLPAFTARGNGAVVSSSRQIIFAYEKLEDPRPTREEIAGAIKDAALKARDDVNSAVSLL
ncbi:MAG: orotidine-5'-phosphate decarboxylase [Firmicutes bacterium]|jgi:orotidine-5'-phosphate decarboxylase|nr:orotidine-5'-phosphate decarboxylase [Candidatus Fermentithermobacillaceae bacterium]